MAVRVITGVPDEVLKWMGGGKDSLGAAPEMVAHGKAVAGVLHQGAREAVGPNKKGNNNNREAGPHGLGESGTIEDAHKNREKH